ncbi:DUF4386 domain-containing protein [Pontivivens insulae]|uniref:DUF4386 domain-containing protein n=1 Tax=Pontivivens insulae TaxID=1639689 RepID=A0A2R8AFZ5_9RHOB|nr:DUF4386 domain-containing protein [Pontivivens insulae]RED10651.1 uncharacterized protein DUF4386 [Pontivivens insulae]SPF31139.1 hypothetical protein POI8812_03490 [Pontivivens insulae]
MKTLLLSPGQVRFAGLCYLIIILCGVGSEVALRGPLIDLSSADGTAQAILAQMMRFRMSIMVDVLMALADVTLAILLFWMFRPVSAGLALTAMIFRLLQAGLIAAGLLNLQAAVLLLQSGTIDDRSDLVLTFIAMHAYGYDLGLIFFGINCLLTGALIVQSGFVPRVLGIGIALSGVVYLSGSVLRFVAPDLHGIIVPAYGVPLVAETAFCLWLLFTRRSGSTATS